MLIVKKIIKNTLFVYIIYFICSGLVPFIAVTHDYESTLAKTRNSSFFGESEAQDRVVLVEDRLFALQGRLDLFAKAEKSIDITLHIIYFDRAGDLIFGALAAAAGRGIQVRIILDGFFCRMAGNRKSIEYALAGHPNISVKYYEKINLMEPWALQNRLHDKFIIIDNRYAMIGGRNIGDDYLLSPDDDDAIEDRDVVIVNTMPESPDKSVISDFKKYFDKLWNCAYATEAQADLSRKELEMGAAKRKLIMEQYNNYRYKYKYQYDWNELSVPANSVELIYNPVSRMIKEPVILAEISNLLNNAKENVIIQSPYVIPDNSVLSFIDHTAFVDLNITVLTNSLASSPNLFAMAGYKRYRDEIMDQVNLFEYQGRDSIHAKTILIDNRISIIGSFNIDPRSTFLSTETMVVIDSEIFASQLKSAISCLMERSVYINDEVEYPENKALNNQKPDLGKQAAIFILGLFLPLMNIFL